MDEPRHPPDSGAAAAAAHRVLDRPLPDDARASGAATSLRALPPTLAAGGSLIVGLAIVGPILCLLPGARAGTVRMLGFVALVSLAAYLITPESAAGPAGDPRRIRVQPPLRRAAAGAVAGDPAPAPPCSAGPRRQAAVLAALAAALLATLIRPSLWPDRTRPRRRASRGGAAARRPGAAGVAAAVAPSRVLVAVRCRGPADRRRGGRLPLAAPLPARALQFTPRRVVPVARVGVLPRRPRRARRRGRALSAASSRTRCAGRTTPTACSTSAPAARTGRSPRSPLAPHGDAAINAGHYDYVVTTPARDPWHPKRLSRSPEDRWTGTDRDAQLVLSRARPGSADRGVSDPGTAEPPGLRRDKPAIILRGP